MTEGNHSLPLLLMQIKQIKYSLVDHCDRINFSPLREDFDTLILLKKELRDALFSAEKLMTVWTEFKSK